MNPLDTTDASRHVHAGPDDLIPERGKVRVQVRSACLQVQVRAAGQEISEADRVESPARFHIRYVHAQLGQFRQCDSKVQVFLLSGITQQAEESELVFGVFWEVPRFHSEVGMPGFVLHDEIVCPSTGGVQESGFPGGAMMSDSGLEEVPGDVEVMVDAVIKALVGRNLGVDVAVIALAREY